MARDPTGRPLYDDYLSKNRGHGEDRPRLDRATPGRRALPHLHDWVASRHAHVPKSQIMSKLTGQVRTFVPAEPAVRGTMCEVLHHDASKWSAAAPPGRTLGCDPFGDLRRRRRRQRRPDASGAGLGVAMGHAPAEVQAAADHITGDHDNDGVAMFIDELLR